MSRTPERLQYYLADPDASRVLGFSAPRPTPTVVTQRAVAYRKTPSSVSESRSTTGSSTTDSNSNSDGGSSTSSRSSAPSMPPWQPLTLNQQIAMAFDYGYDLPCECSFMDCRIRFHPEYHQEWITHSASHFTVHPPPRKLVCTFCPAEFDSGSNGDRMANYTRRMNHIGQHFYESRSLHHREHALHPRPDYFVLEYLWQTGQLNDQRYNELIQYSERPHCDGLQRAGFVTPEQAARRDREQRESRGHHDQAKEDRHRRREQKGGKGKGKTYQSEKSRTYNVYVDR